MSLLSTARSSPAAESFGCRLVADEKEKAPPWGLLSSRIPLKTLVPRVELQIKGTSQMTLGIWKRHFGFLPNHRARTLRLGPVFLHLRRSETSSYATLILTWYHDGYGPSLPSSDFPSRKKVRTTCSPFTFAIRQSLRNQAENNFLACHLRMSVTFSYS